MYAQFFGTFLLSHNVVTKDQLLSALGKKSSQHMKLGTLAIMKGYMTANEVDNVIISQTHNDCRFGEWKIVLNKDEKPLEEGSIASVIEEAVVEDSYREKELVEEIEAIDSKAKKRKEK